MLVIAQKAGEDAGEWIEDGKYGGDEAGLGKGERWEKGVWSKDEDEEKEMSVSVRSGRECFSSG